MREAKGLDPASSAAKIDDWVTVVGAHDFDVALAPGQILGGRFRVERLLGVGGMGAVVAAEHLDLRQRVAVKLLRAELAQTPETLERFLREARASARLRSEHVVHVTDVGILDGAFPYMVMEYLEGQNLAHYLARRGPLPVAELVELVFHALDGLAEAHHQGIIHRDLKPSNLFLSTAPDGQRLVKVLDFGISKVPADLACVPQLTSACVSLGSPRYMSPEQARNPSQVDRRTDIWALGVTLYELATGRAPFEAATTPKLLAAICRDEPTPLTELAPDLPPEFVAVVMRCLQKEPAQRFQHVAEMAAALVPLANSAAARWWFDRIVRIGGVGEPVAGPACHVTLRRAPPRHSRLPPAWVIVLAGALAAAGAGFFWWSMEHAARMKAAPVPVAASAAPSGTAGFPPVAALPSVSDAPTSHGPVETRAASARVAPPATAHAPLADSGTRARPTSVRPLPRPAASDQRAIDFTNPFAGPRRPIDQQNPFGK